MYLMLDIGGTEIKAGVLDEHGAIQGGIRHFSSNAKADQEAILDHFSMIIKEMAGRWKGASIDGIGMAFPGPFDYERGISLMQGLDKYDSIYGISIEEEMKKRTDFLQDTIFCFLHDVEAFALGESWFGEGREAGRLLCLCIGTGTGSAFIENKKVIKEKTEGVPDHGWIYNLPYRDSIIDDYLSVRGLLKISREITGTELNGKELYERCLEQEEKALLVYHRFGEELNRCMCPFLEAFHPDCVVLGGQISKSFPYFGEAFKKECEKRNTTVCLEPETSARAMQGLFVAMSH